MDRARFSQRIQEKKAVEEYNLIRPSLSFLTGLPEQLDDFPTPREFKKDIWEFFRTEQVIPVTKADKEKTVCIIGAGAAGLFTGMIFDYLNSIPELGLNIKYDILEASDGKKRKGGRLFTYNFPKDVETGEDGVRQPDGSHDYYDVGAMRFPEAPQMKRLFRLFKRLGMEKDKSDTKTLGALIPYYMHSQWDRKDPSDFKKEYCHDPFYFNNIQKPTSAIPDPGVHADNDPFEMNKTTVQDNKIDNRALELGPGPALEKVIMDFIDGEDLYVYDSDEDGNKTGHTIDPETGSKLLDYDKLWKYDHYSTRGYLQGTADSGPGYNYFTIQWLETFGAGTGWYDQAWLETVLEFLDFNPLTEKGAQKNQKSYQWWCVNGGVGQLIDRMETSLKSKPQYKSRVTKIENADRSDPKAGLKVYTEAGRPKIYSTVFASPPLGCMRRINLDDLNTLEYEVKLALRTLTYGPSTKVGIKFKSAWWRDEKFKIGLGGVAYTDANLRMCVYPSYSLEPDEPAVLIASYAWSQDAMRVSTLVSKQSPKNEDMLLDLLFHELAKLHSKTDDAKDYKEVRNMIKEQYLDHYSWSWYSGADSTGAFAFFGPGQYSSLWPSLMQREALQKLFFIGEHTSAFHAWVEGAIDSAQRAVFQFCETHGFLEAKKYLRDLPKDKEEAEKYPFAPLPPDFKETVQTMRHNLLAAKIYLNTAEETNIDPAFIPLFKESKDSLAEGAQDS